MKKDIRKILSVTILGLAILSIPIASASPVFADEYDKVNKNYAEKFNDIFSSGIYKLNALSDSDRAFIEARISQYSNNSGSMPTEINQFVVFKNGVKVFENTSREGMFYLASTAKVAVMYQLGQVLREKGIDVDQHFIGLTRSHVTEAINSTRFLAMPFLFQRRADVLGLQQYTRNLLNSYFANPGSFNSSQFNDLVSRVSSDFQGSSFSGMNVSFRELSEMNLIASLNGPVSLVRGYMIYYYADKYASSYPNEQDRYDTGFNLLTNNIKLYLPSYEMTKSYSSYDLWFQQSPNVGNIVEYTRFFDNLMKSANKRRPNPYNASIANSIKNNPYNFNFDITSSSARGSFTVYEKTGLYPAVYWPKKLADLGYAPHLSISSIFTLSDGTNQYTFGMSKAVKVSVPPRTLADGLPNEYDYNYSLNEIGPKQAIYFQNFRIDASNLIQQFAK